MTEHVTNNFLNNCLRSRLQSLPNYEKPHQNIFPSIFDSLVENSNYTIACSTVPKFFIVVSMNKRFAIILGKK